MTRADMESLVYQDFGYAAAPATTVTTRIRGYLNDRHRRIVSRPGMEKFRNETGTFATVASTPTYGLDMPIAKILKITDTTNNHPLWERGFDWYRITDPDPADFTVLAEYWIYRRLGPALRNIGGTGVWIVSTSATDAGGSAVTALVETIDTVTSITSTTAASNGTTRVQVGTATNHQRLLRFSISAAAVGEIELYDAATGGNLVSQIEIGRTTAQFVTISLWPTPSAVVTIQVDYLHQIRDFTTAYTEPQLPLDFHYLVVLGAKIDEARQKGNDEIRSKEWQMEYYQGLQDLSGFVIGYDTIIVPGEIATRGRSNLGAGFPPGVW